MDILIGIMWAVGMSLGIILVNLTPGYQSNLMNYLFGSLLAVTQYDLIYMAILLSSIIAIMLFFYREILAVSYDREYARLRGVKTKWFYTLILILSSLTVVISIKIIGLILVIALMTIPIYIASFFAKKLVSMMMISTLLSLIFSLIGLTLSYRFDLNSGPCIIITGSLCALLVFLYRLCRH